MQADILEYKLSCFEPGKYDFCFDDKKFYFNSKLNNYEIEYEAIKFFQERKVLNKLILLIFFKDGTFMKLMIKNNKQFIKHIEDKKNKYDRNIFEFD